MASDQRRQTRRKIHAIANPINQARAFDPLTNRESPMKRQTLCFAMLAGIGLTACHPTRQSLPPTDAAASASRAAHEQQSRQYAAHKTLAAPPAPAAAANPVSRTQGGPMLEVVAVTGSRPATADVVANTEKYALRDDNPVQRTTEHPVSTFSIDVDTGSYSNVRRMLNDGLRPPADAVRAEEFINYFHYGHPAPASRAIPFKVSTELAPAPWNASRQLLMIGIKGYDVPAATLPPANLVLLIDTSGSMQDDDKLPLLKRALSMLVTQLRPQDRVSIVVYAGSAGLVLPPTPGDRQGEILAALDRLEAGGSTNGGDGIRLAYAMARQAFVKDGVNRVILASDGDFNVGTVDSGALETLVADQRKGGIALTTLGFGQGNYNDALAEKLADVGDGNHAYIDSVQEARKVLVEAMGSTLLTIARDVKVQVEFNPALVAEYRLVGYENRVLQREDFANDAVDAGDIGAGHEVTALYEITPVGAGIERLPALRYGAMQATGLASRGNAGEVAHLRLRYKHPGDDRSRLIETPILLTQLRAQPGDSMHLAAAVAGFADALRGGKRTDGWGWQAIAQAARAGRREDGGEDHGGERAELLGLIETARQLTAGHPGTPAIGEPAVSR
jgi:Ca-activated chloride channel family protein